MVRQVERRRPSRAEVEHRAARVARDRTMRVPLIKPDLPRLDEVADPFGEILDSGRITNFGKYATAFEEEAAAYLGAPAVTVSSGTVGLIFTLQAMGLAP